ncbi:Endogenous Retrovirus Group S71 Member 1 Env Polyprotein [Manis pentadactyla]|nr:Endogenous Retrovirus Group S71 Member 1 Env Polyprotein [Manis pentadactyla]
MVDQGYCEGKAMRMIRLRRELGVNSDVMAKVIYRLRDKTCFLVGINIEGGVSSPVPGYTGYDVDAVTDRFRNSLDVRVKARLDLHHHGVASESINADAEKDLQNIELHLVIASDPDVRAMARLSFRFTDWPCETFAAGVGSGYVVDGDTDRFSIVLRCEEDEGQIHLHRMVASVTSVLMLRVQVKRPGLGG